MPKDRSREDVDDSLLESASGGAGTTGGNIQTSGSPKITLNVTNGSQIITENGKTVSSSDGSSVSMPNEFPFDGSTGF